MLDALDLVRTGASPALVLEDFGGESLATRTLPLPVRDFPRIARQVVTALGRIPGAEVIHKDVKPSNIRVSADGSELKFIDFQIASEISRERQYASVENQLEGSLPYMSPSRRGA